MFVCKNLTERLDSREAEIVQLNIYLKQWQLYQRDVEKEREGVAGGDRCAPRVAARAAAEVHCWFKENYIPLRPVQPVEQPVHPVEAACSGAAD